MVSFFIILFGVTMLYVSATSRLEAYIKVLSVQGIILFLIVLFDFSHMHKLNAVFLTIETLGFKAILIPWFLIVVVRRNGIFREVEPYISNFNSIVIASLIFSFGFFLSYWSNRMGQDIKPLYFGISVSTMITGLFLVMSRKKIITHVMGYMMLENGIFLLSLSVAKEMPLIVNLGVLLDVFVGIFLLGLFVNRVQSVFDEMHIDALSELKD
jgi:hydrogenase-4 component E